MPTAQTASSELRRSVEYVDKKLELVLGSLGTDRHQQAVVALFQAKTALEFALGTESDPESCVDALVVGVEQNHRPRIRSGSVPKTQRRESNTLAAS